MFTIAFRYFCQKYPPNNEKLQYIIVSIVLFLSTYYSYEADLSDGKCNRSRLYSLEYELKFEPAYIVYEKVSKFILSSAPSIYGATVSVIRERNLSIIYGRQPKIPGATQCVF